MRRVDHLAYHALVERAGHLGGSLFHLVREGSEASLCGIHRDRLQPGRSLQEIVCSQCIEWLPKRLAASGQNSRVEST